MANNNYTINICCNCSFSKKSMPVEDFIKDIKNSPFRAIYMIPKKEEQDGNGNTN